MKYTGHGSNTGGLQRHSIGSLYPYTVIAKGDPAHPDWCAMDLRTGKEGRLYRTYKEAEIDVGTLLVRNLMHS